MMFQVQNCIVPQLMTQPNVSSSLVRLQPCNHVFFAAYASIRGIVRVAMRLSLGTSFCDCVCICLV
jgi:hypothetical protein